MNILKMLLKSLLGTIVVMTVFALVFLVVLGPPVLIIHFHHNFIGLITCVGYYAFVLLFIGELME